MFCFTLRGCCISVVTLSDRGYLVHEIVGGEASDIGINLVSFVYSTTRGDYHLLERLKEDRDCAEIVLSEQWCRCELCGKRVKLNVTDGGAMSIERWLIHKIECRTLQLVSYMIFFTFG